MGIFNQRKKEVVAPVKEERSFNLGSLFFNRYSTYSQAQAMRLSAVYCAVNQISNSIAMLQANIVDVSEGEKKAISHPLYPILNARPNRRFNHFSFWKLMVESLMLRGNAYAAILRDDNLNVEELVYLDSANVTPMPQNDGSVKYLVNGVNGLVDACNMIHLFMHCDENMNGISIIKYASNALACASDADKHAGNFFKSGANLSGVIKSSAPLTNEQKNQIRDSWNSAFGANNDGVGVAVLPMGLDFQPISVSPEDAQLLDSRKYSVLEIARFFNISPIKLYQLEDVSYNSMESAQIYYLTDTVLPYAQLIEDELNNKIFKPSEFGKREVDFDFSVLLSTDKKSEAEYYKTLLVNGICSLNEVRNKLGYERVEDGDHHYMQLAMTTVENIISGANFKNPVDNKLKQGDNTKEDDKEE